MLSSNTSAVSGDANYIEDVFSTYLYTGNGSTQTITNNIDLATKGGLVWLKDRSAAASNLLYDTTRGAGNKLSSNATTAQVANTSGYDLTSFSSTGFSLGPNEYGSNTNTETYASWTFRKQPKFFDVVTYTGTGSATTIAHSLGSVPGCIIVKRTNSAAAWRVYHRSLTSAAYYVDLNTTGIQNSDNTIWNSTAPTSSVFSVGTSSSVNGAGDTYVAYIFAHDAGGFGLTGTDNVISCGSYTGNADSNGPVVTLGWEPQWVLIKRRSGTAADWCLFDTMRGIPTGGDDSLLEPNTTAAEQNALANWLDLSATGFQIKTTAAEVNATGAEYIYIAIRRGPMKVPTDATKVFAPVTRTGASSTVTSNTNPDLVIPEPRIAGYGRAWLDKLRGKIGFILSNATTEEYAGATATITDWGNTGVLYNSAAGGPANDSGVAYVDYYLTRAPSFFDEVCYTGTGANRTVTHNLGVAPELMIVKNRSAVGNWPVYAASLANTQYLRLNTNAIPATGSTYWNSTSPTSTVFSLGTTADVNTSGSSYVAYLFATCPGVSKVGSYTGTGATQTIDCGFTGGARFVLIKRTNSASSAEWFVWDTARGMVSGTDPYLALQSTAAEVNANWVYTATGGFQIVTSNAGVNASGSTYIYLAIA